MIRRNFFSTIAFMLFIFIHTMQAQTLFTYGNKTVSKTEFLKAYGKNNTGEKPSQTSYRDYLDLYTKFKIKVQAALDMKLDTLANLNAELQNFRSQIAQNFMNDEGSMQELINEAYSRGLKDIHLAHIFIPLKKEDSAGQVQKAQNKINKAFEALNHRSFDQVALEFSEDPSVKNNRGDIGYITVFVLPYNIENVVYALTPGQYSKPFRSAAGFHIFKNIDERKAAGRIRAAQILLSVPPGSSKPQQDLVKAKADSIVKAVRNGADFKKLALQLSHDNLSYQNGGEMPEFGVGRYDPVFESAAFALNKNDEVSQPVLSEFGYHIIKRISLKAVQQDKNDEKWRDSIRQVLVQSDRMQASQKKLLRDIQQKTAFKKFPYNQKTLWRLTDSVLANKMVPELPDMKSNTPLFSFSKQTLRVKDWENYVESIRSIPSLVSGKTNSQLFEQFVETSSLEYYRDHLEQYSPQFLYQLSEFKEGNLLFEVMQREIWDAASQDTIALKKFYESNDTRYWWENSADAIVFICNDDSTVEKVKTSLQTGSRDWRKLIDNSNGTLQADSGRYELSQIPVPDRTNFTEGLVTAEVKNESENTITFAYILKLYKARERRSFQDARGFVTNDYQEYLENKWVAELKKKYPVKINENVFTSLPK